MASLSNEDLLALSQMLDTKLRPLEDRTKSIELLLENDVLPRLQNIEACYTSTYRRYADNAVRAEATQEDVGILKKVVSEHSRKLQTLA
ncbi:MAG: hypothetical protein LUF34_09955 [Lachnospiraceae bacterium]|nr:hypothetical protein [Lachnospiraceae bacterium]